MSRFALLVALLCCVGLRQSEGNWWRKSKEAKEIEQVYKLLTSKSSSSESLEDKLRLIDELATKKSNHLASMIAKLNPTTYDQEGTDAANSALNFIKSYGDKARKQTSYLRAILTEYLSRAEKASSDRKIKEFDDCLAKSTPDSSLESKLELIKECAAERGNNELAALIAQLKSGTCDLAGLKALSQTQTVIAKSQQSSQVSAGLLRKVLREYKQQVGESCFKQSIGAWTSNKGALSEDLLEAAEILTDFIQSSVGARGLREDISVLVGSGEMHGYPRFEIGDSFSRFMIDRSGLVASDEPIESEMDKVWDFCDVLLGLEQGIGALEPIFEMSTALRPDELVAVTGELGGERSQLVEWAGRWRVCGGMIRLGPMNIEDMKEIMAIRGPFLGRRYAEVSQHYRFTPDPDMMF